MSLPRRITGLLLAAGAAAQSFSNSSLTSSTNATATCTYSPDDCAAIRRVRVCDQVTDTWLSGYYSYVSTATFTSSSAYRTDVGSTVIWTGNYTGPLSTFCDGVPRGGSPPAITSFSTLSLYSYYPPYPTPAPNCTYDYRGCEILIDEFRASPRGPTFESPKQPECAGDTAQCINPEGASCPIDAGDVRLIYWPQSKDPSELCASGTKSSPVPSITPAPAVPFTTVIDGYTFASPTVYLSFSSLDGLPCYKHWDNAIVPITDLADLSSVSFPEGTGGLGVTSSINWNDLNSPVPMSAYIGQQSCLSAWRGSRYSYDKCSTIYDDYLPWLALPTRPAVYTDVDARFENCTKVTWRKFVFDPPLALTSAGGLIPASSSPTEEAPPTITSDQQTVPATDSASPAPEPESPTATATTNQQDPTEPTAAPEDPSTSATSSGGGGLGPIISIIVSSISATAGDPPASNDPGATTIIQPVDPGTTNVPPSDPSDPSSVVADPTNGGTTADPTTISPVPTNGDPATLLPNDPPGPTAETTAPGDPNDPSVTGLTTVGGATTIPFPSDPAAPADPSTNNGAGGAATTITLPANTDPDPADPAPATNTGAPAIVAASPDPADPGGGGVVIVPDSSAAGGGGTALTLAPGQTGVVDGSVPVAVPSSGGAVVVGGGGQSGGGQTFAVPAATATQGVGGGAAAAGPGGGEQGAVITGSGGVVVTAVPGGQQQQQPGSAGVSGGVVVVAGSTLTAGGAAASVSGVGVVSAGSGGVVVNGGSTAGFSEVAAPSQGAVITGSGGTVVTTLPELQSGAVVVAGTTLTPGSPAASVSGVGVVSAGSAGVVVNGGSTAGFSALASSGGQDSAAVVTLDGDVQTISAPQGSGSSAVVVVDGTTLTVGGAAATVGDGEVVSAVSGGLVVDGTTVPFESVSGAGTVSAVSSNSSSTGTGTGLSTSASASRSGTGVSGATTAASATASSSGASRLLENWELHMVMLAFISVMAALL